MAIITNTFETYDAKGNREDLEDIIYNVSPTDTPMLSMIADKETTQAKLHEWQTDTLAAASENHQIEGNDYTSLDASTASVRVGARHSISAKTVIISGTQEAVNSAGRKSELAYQLMKRSKELKRDMETVITGNNASVTGVSDTASETGGMESWYETNTSRGATGSDGGFSSGNTSAAGDGTQRAFTESLLKDVIQQVYASGGNPDCVMVGPKNKQVVSTFTGNGTRFHTNDGTLATSVDVYQSDFGELTVLPNRFQRERTAHVLQKDMWAVGYLRPFQQTPLAKTGDAEKRLLLAEYCLISRNEQASGVIADLNT